MNKLNHQDKNTCFLSYNVIFHLQSFKHRKIIEHRAPNVHQFIVVKVSVKENEIIKLFTAAATFYIFKTIINNSLAFWPIMSTIRCHVRLIITGQMNGILKCLCDEILSNVFNLIAMQRSLKTTM